MTIIGLDISKWQGSNIDWNKMVSSGVKFIYLKASQGNYHKDELFDINIDEAIKVGLKVGAYHFVTGDNPAEQYNWFIGCMGDHKFDLTPALDCEGNYGATEAIIDAIGRKLSGFQGFQYPTIYTNPSWGNAHFKTASMSRYPLWIAHWGVASPTMPKVWAGKKYYAWQDGVVDGVQYGISGKVDHDIWGELMPFPGDEPIPPQPAGKLKIEIKYKGETHNFQEV